MVLQLSEIIQAVGVDGVDYSSWCGFVSEMRLKALRPLTNLTVTLELLYELLAT